MSACVLGAAIALSASLAPAAAPRSKPCRSVKCLPPPPAVPPPTSRASFAAAGMDAIRTELKLLSSSIPKKGLTHAQRRFLQRRLGAVHTRRARAASGSTTTQGPPDDAHVGDTTHYSDAEKDQGDGAKGRATGTVGGSVDRCPASDGTLHGTYTNDVSIGGSVDKAGQHADITFSIAADATYVGHAGEDGVVHTYDLQIPHLRILKRIVGRGGGGAQVVYGRVTASVRETVVDGTRTAIQLSGLKIIGDFTADEAWAALKGILNDAEFGAQHDLEGADLLCNWFDVTLDSDVTRTGDDGSKSFHYHVTGGVQEIHTNGSFSRPLNGSGGQTAYTDASGTAHETNPCNGGGDYDTVTTASDGRGDVFAVPALHFRVDGGYPGNTITVELVVGGTELYTVHKQIGSPCDGTYSYRSPDWKLGFLFLHSENLNGENPILSLQPGAGGSDFADATFTGHKDDGQDTWDETTTVHVIHTPKTESQL